MDRTALPSDFPSTHWSILTSLTDPADPAFRHHLNALIERYWRPAYSYLRNLPNVASDEALDLAQEFFTRLLERGRIGDLAPQQGHFRGYLKVALRNFSISASRGEAVRRPRDGARLFHIDGGDAPVTPPAPDLSPEEAFDREWARGVLDEGIQALKAALEEQGKAVYFELFREYFLAPAGLDGGTPAAEPSYESLAARHGVAAHDVANHLRYARKRLTELLKEHVRRYLGEADDPEAELRFLLSK